MTVRPNSERAAGADLVAAVAAGMGAVTHAAGDPAAGLSEALARAHAADALLVAAGSLYLVGGIRTRLLAGR